MVEILGLKRGTVRLIPHEDGWEQSARETIAELRILCPDAVEIRHVGSTAIRGIHAKPILDLAVAVERLETAEGWMEAMSAAGYRFCGADQPDQLLFTKGEGEIRTHHVHVVLWKGPAWNNYLNFRDYLNTHPDRAAAYDGLKQALAAQYADDRKTYTAKKTTLIDALLKEAREWRNAMNWNTNDLSWTREPLAYTITDDKIEIVTKPHTDLWQRTYYHFRNDNAPVLQMETEEKFFSFTVKTAFDSKHRFDQCGVVLYLDSENWIKGSIEYENEHFQHLGSVVTNHGYSDWATTEIPAHIKSMWYRLSRREDDYCIECSEDGVTFRQMRVCHLWEGGGAIRFGVYACSPEESSFKATFTHMEMTDCKWLPHDGQQPDE